MFPLWFAASARAATLVVDPGGGAGTYPTIQDAIDAAVDGDLVSVVAGTYVEAIDFAGKTLEVRGAAQATTILDNKGASENAVTIANGEGEGTVLANLTIRNGTERGLFVANASPTLEDVKFDHLGHSDSILFHGGGAWVDGGTALFTDCTFSNNGGWFGADLYVTTAADVTLSSSKSTSGSALLGGSAYVLLGTLTLDTVTVESAFAGAGAGAIYVGPDSTLVTDTCALYRNTTFHATGEDGGAIYLSAGATWEDLGSTLADNVADRGGAVYAIDATILAELTTFTSNGTAIQTEAGGAVYATGSGSTTLIGATFDANEADNGGAIYSAASLTIDGATFLGSYATVGGGLYTTGDATVTNSVFAHSEAERDGGAVYSTGTTTLGFVDLVDNTCLSTSGRGGGVYSTGALVVEDSLFTNNRSATADIGGGIYASGATTIHRSVFSGNSYSAVYSVAAVTVTDSTFSDNLALANSFGGGAINTVGAIDVSGSGFERNTLSAVRGGGDITVRDSTFTDNDDAEGSGGAIHLLGSPVDDLLVEDCTFTLNTTEIDGGAIHASGLATVNIRGSSFTGNGASGTETDQQGGAIYLSDVDVVSVVGNTFCANHAYDGGAIHVLSSDAALQGGDEYLNNVFQGNTATNSGGAFFAVGSPYLGLTNNTFVANASSNGLGGAASLDAATAGTVTNNVFAATVSGDAVHGDTTAAFTYNLWHDNAPSDVGGGLTALEAFGTGSVFADPLFAAWTDNATCDDALHPGLGSPLVDAGDPAVLDYDGSVSDIGYSGGPLSTVRDDDRDGALVADDCDDLDPLAYPGAPEVWYDGVDQACDDGDDFDQDRDGVPVASDCDDTDAAVYPAAVEVWYDGVDSDCDGASDFDQDRDGHDGGAGGVDCADTDPEIHPGADDPWYDGVDGDCDGASDYDQDGDGDDRAGDGGGDCADTDASRSSLVAEIWYDGVDGDCDGGDDFDQDGDGAALASDCDDTDAAVEPGAPDVWYDGVDSDCDGADDFDQDGDGDARAGDGGDDCDDEDPQVSSLAAETWYDGVDGDCDGADDFDQDADRVPDPEDCDDADPSVHPGAAERADGVDSDCDGFDTPQVGAEPGCGGCSHASPRGTGWAILLAGIVAARRSGLRAARAR